jgi:hypothetical protein
MDTPMKPQQVLLRALSERRITSVAAGATLTAHATPLQDRIQVQICTESGATIAQLLLMLPTTAQPGPTPHETSTPPQPIYPN